MPVFARARQLCLALTVIGAALVLLPLTLSAQQSPPGPTGQPQPPAQDPNSPPDPQENGQDAEADPLEVGDGPDGWWEWRGRDDTRYRVRLSAVQSYGVQAYDIPEGQVSVVELTVDTIGSVSARFYFVTPLGAALDGPLGNAAQEVLAQANETQQALTGRNTEDLVIKTYPQTTHSHTLEFRLRSAAEVEQLADSLAAALDDGQGRTVRGQP